MVIKECHITISKKLKIVWFITSVTLLFFNEASSNTLKCHVHKFQYTSFALYDPSSMMRGMKNNFVEKQKVKMYCRGTINTVLLDTINSLVSKVVVFNIQKLIVWNNDIPLENNIIADVQDDLTIPIFIRSLPSGLIHSISIDSSILPLSLAFVRNILSLLQVAINNSDSKIYSTKECDPTGKYTAKYYKTKCSGRNLTIFKKKTGYYSLAGGIGDYEDATIRSQYSGRVGYDTRVHNIVFLRAKESKQTFIGSKVIGGSKSDFTATALVDSVIDNVPNKGNEYTLWQPLDIDITSLKIKRTKYERLLGNDNARSIIQCADSLQNIGVGWDDGLFNKIEALLYLRPDSCSELLDYLCNDTTFGFSFSMISLVMAESGSAIGERNLIDAIEYRNKNSKALDLLLPLMLYIKIPLYRTEHILTQLAFGNDVDSESQRTAQLALGNIARNLLKNDIVRSDSITRLIIHQLHSTNDIEQYLAILGNTGSNLAIDEITKYYSYQSISIKCLSLKSLRFIKSYAVDKILRTASKKSSPDLVKKTALDVLRFRKTESYSQ